MNSEIEALRAELAAARQDLEELRLTFPDALLEGDLASERVLFMNRIALRVFGWTPEDVPRLTARDLFAPGDYERAQRDVRERLERGYAEGGGSRYVRSRGQDLREYHMQRQGGAVFPAELHSVLLLDREGHPRAIRTLVRDITARKELEARLEELSYRDPLTGCFNRRYLEKRRAELEAPQAPWTCLVFDLTGFKAINDTYGHEEGDRVLRAFSHYLLRLHRSEDILVRLGGDEFALILRTGEPGEAQGIVDRIVEGARTDSPAAFSLGMAVREPGEDIGAVLARADQVMYAARGRNLRSSRATTGRRRRPV